MNSRQSKIFGIGLSKTGTTSLARALEILGYNTRDYLGVTRYSPGDLSSIDLKTIDSNDAFTDTPIPSFYRELDARYPGSKFILTARDPEGWLKSCRKQFTRKLSEKLNAASNQLFMDLYGCAVFNEQKFRHGYENFTRDAYQHFRNRPQDLLVMDIAAGDGWGELCTFLKVPIPDTPFPRANVTRIRWLDINEIIAIAENAGEELVRARELIQSGLPGQGAQSAQRYGKTGKAFAAVRYSFLGGSEGIQRTAVKKVNRTISKWLNEVNPGIPVISRQNNAAPYSERKQWNHFWLIDPLDSSGGLLVPGGDFSVNIALIEDRKPVLGVVHLPAKAATYYSMTGKGAFRIEAGGKPQNIETRLMHNNSSAGLAGQDEASQDTQTASSALSICLFAEGKPDSKPPLDNTSEWETAAAQAILMSAGMAITSRDTNSELTYNKENFRNGSLVIK